MYIGRNESNEFLEILYNKREKRELSQDMINLQQFSFSYLHWPTHDIHALIVSHRIVIKFLLTAFSSCREIILLCAPDVVDVRGRLRF